ncbi:MAG TPA: hypothetical protein VHR38_01460 [Solirubrobacterales bacterium]|jgi:hypothetical protein|nr:hypothetical protein [Solirubrobacterales bacterium]
MTDANTIEIRILGLEDGAAVNRLAQLDTAAPPPSPLLGGIVDGRLVAAHSLASGESIADPFRRTAEVRALLAERAGQLHRGRGRGLLSGLRHRLTTDISAPTTTASEGIR